MCTSIKPLQHYLSVSVLTFLRSHSELRRLVWGLLQGPRGHRFGPVLRSVLLLRLGHPQLCHGGDQEPGEVRRTAPVAELWIILYREIQFIPILMANMSQRLLIHPLSQQFTFVLVEHLHGLQLVDVYEWLTSALMLEIFLLTVINIESLEWHPQNLYLISKVNSSWFVGEGGHVGKLNISATFSNLYNLQTVPIFNIIPYYVGYNFLYFPLPLDYLFKVL